ncbi:MAG TPA: TetR/AcrR family transcriptional regulator [Solirubrobacterales bacterium]|nr:TetR/AcrR family transcriptional regulator [Solirubrobacterales bacterium]
MTEEMGQEQGVGGAPAAPVKTPWGDVDSLRERRLRPGQRLPRKEVKSNQRARLFAAMVAVCSEKSYEATRVADLLELSGVSRKAFYELFDDKRACMLAAVHALISPAVEAIAATDDVGGSEERARQAFEAFIRLIVDQAPAAKMCFVEVFAAGAGGADEFDRATDAFLELSLKMLRNTPGRAKLPPEIVRAMLGGARKVIQTRLYLGNEAELVDLSPDLWAWAMSYTPPPEPLRPPRERARKSPAGLDGYDPVERILRALASVVAEKGYPQMTVSDVAERASISLSTFYSHFADKEEAMLAAVDSGSAQMLATTLPAFRRAPDWPHAVRGAYGAMFAFCAAEPDYTTLGAIDVYAAGRKAMEQRDGVMKGMEALLIPGYERNPDVSPVAGEAIGGAIYSMINDRIKQHGAASLQGIAPLATYVTLAPFVGPEEACEVANGDGRGS